MKMSNLLYNLGYFSKSLHFQWILISGHSLFLRVQVRQVFDPLGGDEGQPPARRLPGRTRPQPLLPHQKQIPHPVLQVSSNLV